MSEERDQNNELSNSIPLPDKMNSTELPQLFKLMKGSFVLNVVYEYVIKIITGKVSDMDFFKNKNNNMYLTIGICLFMASSLIGLMSYFLFYVMFFFSSLKCILWLFEQYTPDTSDETKEDISTRYVTEKSPIDVLEYYVVPIFIVLIVHPLAFIPVPMVSLVVHGFGVMLGIATMTNKAYRQKFCIFIRDLFTSRDSRDADGKYVPGHEGEIHKLLQTLCYSIECVNLSAFHLTHNPRATYDKLCESKNLAQGFHIVTAEIDVETKTTRESKKHNDKNSYVETLEFCDELDEY